MNLHSCSLQPIIYRDAQAAAVAIRGELQNKLEPFSLNLLR